MRPGRPPSSPRFDKTPLELDPEQAVLALRDGSVRLACEHPDVPVNYPRVLALWRANLLGASSKGHESFLGAAV